MATSSTSSTYVPPISIPGIGTNIDVNNLVTKLIQAESKGMALRQTQQKTLQMQLSAVGSLKSALASKAERKVLEKQQKEEQKRHLNRFFA